MKCAVTGSNGLIGGQLCRHLVKQGHQVIRLVRKKKAATGGAQPNDDECLWDPEQGIQELEKLAGVEAVIHLAGRSIADHRWTQSEKKMIRTSRVDATNRLCRDLQSSVETTPAVFISASAIGIYGDCGIEWVDESHVPGNDFLAKIAIEWEAAGRALSSDRTRTVQCRFGVVLASSGGALAKMLPLFRWGLAGRLGNGHQYMSWIAIDDVVRAIEHLMLLNSAEGAFNTVAPEPVTNREFTAVLAAKLHRPALLPAPAWALRLALGEMADAALLSSCRVEPKRLSETGFKWLAPQLSDALELCGIR